MTFEIGQKVAVSKASGIPKMWIGFVGTVVEPNKNDPDGTTRISPLSLRPDGFEYLEFLWDTDNLETAE